MADLKDEIEAFERMRRDLEAENLGRWVLFYGGQLVDVFESFEAAADEAVRRFGRGPYLIRQVGAPPLILPVSVMYHRPNAQR